MILGIKEFIFKTWMRSSYGKSFFEKISSDILKSFYFEKFVSIDITKNSVKNRII